MAVMPPNVAAGELIESAWGNQVVGKLAELWSLDIQGDQTVLSTNASGAFAFTFPRAFATAPKTVQFTTGDMARAAAIITVNATTTTASGCDGVISGTAPPTPSSRPGWSGSTGWPSGCGHDRLRGS